MSSPTSTERARRGSGLGVGTALAASVPLLATLVFVTCVDVLTVEVSLSFVVLGLAMSLHGLHAVRGNANSAADASVFVFGLLFLLVAPIVQISVLGLKLVNTTHATPDRLVQANLACALFIGVYLLGRITVFRPPLARPFRTDLGEPGPRISDFALALMVVSSAFISLVSIPFIGASAADASVTPVLLAFRKFLFFLPTALFLIALADTTNRSEQKSFLHLLLLVLLFACVLVTQNPATEKRNGLGPVYLGAAFLVFRARLPRKSVQVAWLVGVLLVLFPLTSVLTTVPWKYLDEIDFPWTVFSDHFISTHYDAWANIYTTVEMVERNGISGGQQLAGAALFYVPSTWWHGKPLATGIEIGNFLMTHYQMWFTNLSAPLVAEGFLDFGYLGVVAYALGLAALVKGVETWAAPGRSATSQAIAMYLAFFLVFVLRGSLMIAVAYGCGAMAAFVVARALIGLTAARPRRAGAPRPGWRQIASSSSR